MALSDSEKERIRYHLGYLGTSNNGAALTAGLPTAIQPLFLIEKAMDFVTAESELRVRSLLSTLDALEEKLKAAVCQLGVDRVGNITLAGGGGSGVRAHAGMLVTDRIEAEIHRWAMRLADVLGVPVYPFSSRFSQNKGAGNIKVNNG